MRYGILGPLVLWTGPDQSTTVSGRDRIVLCLLLLRANQVVTIETLIDALWPAGPPASARAQVHGCAFRLRRLLPDGALRTRPDGYLLRVVDDELDAAVFERTLGLARAAVAAGRLPEGRTLSRQALALWRGPVLDGVSGAPAWAGAVRLDEAHLAAWEECVEVELRIGDNPTLIGELTGLVARYPLHERFRQQLMLALVRAGRQADALEAFRQARADLADQIGVEPGPALEELHRRILRGDPDLVPPTSPPRDAPRSPVTAPPPPAAQLPPSPRGFAGRQDHLTRLDAILDSADAHTLVIAAITGTAGVGKTSLAIHYAHRVRHRYPDGQLYLNLRGFNPGEPAMHPDEAVRCFLDALGVAPEYLPPDPVARANRYRSLLAGRRMLVLLDNARDTGQIRPLLPGSPGCLVLVTSRDQLTQLLVAEGAHPVGLDVLSPAESDEVLRERLGDARVAAEPEAAGDIATACAHLPLALAIAAARAATHPAFPLAALATELRDTGGLLNAWGEPDVTSTFSLSYRTLSPPAARLFRLLSLHPGTLATPSAAASLAGLPVRAVRPVLAELARANLVTEHAPGRFGYHDLLRAYAAELAHTLDAADDRRSALHRLLDHYLHTASTADGLLDPGRNPVPLDDPREGCTAETLAGHAAAYAWFTAEHPALVSCVRLAAEHGFDRHAWQIAWAHADFLYWSGHWQDLISTNELALESARRCDSPTGQAHAHRGLAGADTSLGRHDAAHDHLRQALDLFRRAGRRIDQAHIHRNLAQVLEGIGHPAEALEDAKAAHDLYRAAGDEAGRTRALSSIGWLQALLGDYARAQDSCEQALTRHRELGDHSGEGETWQRLGYVRHRQGHHEQANACYERALALSRQVGNRGLEGVTLHRLGDSHRAAGNVEAARRSWQQALDILDPLENPGTADIRAKLNVESLAP